MTYHEIIDRYYPVGTLRRDIYMRHCRQVADLALRLARENRLDLDPEMIESAAMLHDIGIFLTNAPGIGCEGNQPYICHGVLGADLLRHLGCPEEWVMVAERHTGSGITAAEVEMLSIPIPVRDYLPVTQLERLICYADKFFSKTGAMQQKTFHSARASIARHGGDSLARFDSMAREFGQP